MARLIWGPERPYEAGVDRGVFYHKNGSGYAWNGLVTVSEATIDASQNLIYIDGVGYTNSMLIGNFAAKIEAITYPAEFEIYDGYSDLQTGLRRSVFDFCYRTMQENDGYKLHLVFNALVEPTTRNNSTFDTNTDVELFSWNLTTSPELIPDARASSHFVVDSKQVNPGLMESLEARLYGTEASAPDMPTVKELLAIFEDRAVFRVTDNGDGTATISGPDDAVFMSGTDIATLSWDSVVQMDSETYQLSSL